MTRTGATLTGAIIVIVSGLVTLALTGAAIYAYLVGKDTESGERLLGAAAAALATTTALAARTRHDPEPIPAGEVVPVEVQQPPGQPVPVEYDPEAGT